MAIPERKGIIDAIYFCPGGTNRYKSGPTSQPHYIHEEYLINPPEQGFCTTHHRLTSLTTGPDSRNQQLR
jgi:hypothetical protein